VAGKGCLLSLAIADFGRATFDSNLGNNSAPAPAITVRGDANLVLNRSEYFEQHQATFGELTEAQRAGVNQLLDFIQNDSALTADGDFMHLRWAAYMLATARHETGITYEPVPENWDRNLDQLRSDRPAYAATSKEDYFNYWYSEVNGNGDYASGDGYRYRGRGTFRLPGAANISPWETRLAST